MPDDYGNDTHKDRAQAWFAQLRDDLCAALEAVELNVEGPNPSSEGEAGTFERKSWERPASDGAADAGLSPTSFTSLTGSLSVTPGLLKKDVAPLPPPTPSV